MIDQTIIMVKDAEDFRRSQRVLKNELGRIMDRKTFMESAWYDCMIWASRHPKILADFHDASGMLLDASRSNFEALIDEATGYDTEVAQAFAVFVSHYYFGWEESPAKVRIDMRDHPLAPKKKNYRWHVLDAFNVDLCMPDSELPPFDGEWYEFIWADSPLERLTARWDHAEALWREAPDNDRLYDLKAVPASWPSHWRHLTPGPDDDDDDGPDSDEPLRRPKPPSSKKKTKPRA